HPRADARAGGAGRDGLSRLRALHGYPGRAHPWRRRLRPPARATRRRHGRARSHAGTPPRFLEDGTANLKDIQYLVLDEVDRMLDMGFLPQVRRIVDRVPRQRQTLFFSATLPPELETMTKWLLK